jgi:threonine aldolase
VLCGSEAFIYQARRARKLVGGGMRQAGILAAAGLISLHEMTERLAVDHAHAHQLAQGLAEIPGIQIDLDKVKTNMVFFSFAEDVRLSAKEYLQQLRQAGIWLGGGYGNVFRAVTHYWIAQPEIDLFIETTRHLFKN